MNDKNLKTVGIAALLVSIITTILVILRASVWEIGLEHIFILWTISPYIFLFIADVVLRRLTSISKLPLIFCVTALLMLAFTLLLYVSALSSLDESSTAGVIFIFAPFYLYIEGIIVFGIGLILTLLAKLPKSW